jgi:hypothetical protein
MQQECQWLTYIFAGLVKLPSFAYQRFCFYLNNNWFAMSATNTLAVSVVSVKCTNCLCMDFRPSLAISMTDFTDVP